MPVLTSSASTLLVGSIRVKLLIGTKMIIPKDVHADVNGGLSLYNAYILIDFKIKYDSGVRACPF